jgi:hypothetical protein
VFAGGADSANKYVPIVFSGPEVNDAGPENKPAGQFRAGQEYFVDVLHDIQQELS